MAASASSAPAGYGSPTTTFSASVTGLADGGLNRGRSEDNDGDQASAPALRSQSIDSLSLNRQPTSQSAQSVSSRDGSTKSGRSGVKKLLPSGSKRKQRKIREEELKLAAEERTRGRPLAASQKAGSVDGNSILTDESDNINSGPPVLSRLPLTSTPPEPDCRWQDDRQPLARLNTVAAVVEPAQSDHSPSPKSPALARPASTLSLGALEKIETLTPDLGSANGSSKLRSRSPGRKLRDVFSKGKSAKASPERNSGPTFTSPLSKSVLLLTDEPSQVQDQVQDPVPPIPPAVELPRAAAKSMPTLDTRPLTPPTATIPTPVTTVTPPTPTDSRLDAPGPPTRTETDSSNMTVKGDNIIVSPSGNMISHRRIRSTSSIVHQPSKLSNSITASSTATIQETRTPSANSTAAATNRSISSSFFSSWMSAAQTAASTLTSLTGQNRSRATTSASDPVHNLVEPIQEEAVAAEPEIRRRQLAVETMGSGDLNFEHLGLDPGSTNSLTRPSFADLRHESVIARDVAAAKAEDALAQKAVSAAYERTDDATPVAEITDPLASLPHPTAFTGLPRQNTPPNGTIIDADATSVKRTTSVRSKLATRSSRGSSAAGQSAIGVLISGSTATLANPASGPRLSGFTMAPKPRNKSFHQQFRSVPDDDYLIDDYSCALQRDILLAGRLYISEGHICFSSNILGWVTTLIISFDEVVNIERENTALVIPNAIAIQTLHARHTFRSLLSRESTYDLLIGIWRVSHPASFQKSMAGRSLVARDALQDATGTAASDKASERVSDGSSDNDSDDDDDDDAHSAPSTVESALSVGPSEMQDPKTTVRMPSGTNGHSHPSPPATAASADAPSALGLYQANGDLPQDFPGPATHPPSECTDVSTHYEIIIKDEVLPAPLGKIYSLLYGPQSGSFVRKFLVDESKSLDLQLEDDKTGLSNDKKTRQYTYIKPLNGSIGPKQTKCITTEELDFFDLDKAVTVTCSTQTPDVPSGASFVTKTRYCLTWAPGNSTRLQMNCTIEWSAKSWLKVAIEKGAKDGQQQYGDNLVKTLKAHLGRARGMTANSKLSKNKKKTKKPKREKSDADKTATRMTQENWDLLEPLRPYLGPVVNVVKPAVKIEYVVAILFIMVLMLWFSKPRPGRGLGPYAGLDSAQKLAVYDEMWRKQETELWDWLEQRAGVNTALLQKWSPSQGDKAEADAARKQKAKQIQRQKVLKGKDMEARLREEKMTQRQRPAADHPPAIGLSEIDPVVNVMDESRDLSHVLDADLENQGAGNRAHLIALLLLLQRHLFQWNRRQPVARQEHNVVDFAHLQE
ncbi:hypothetical protein DV736_g2550, partial [Chaetothyriales sp. CBS 134916]